MDTDTPIPARLASPLRHHRRTPSVDRRPVKETLNARLSYEDDEDGNCDVRINQYTLKREIGRGSYGAVHQAVDTEGKKYAIKEFSKSRLRRRSQAHLLRKPPNGFLNAQGHRRSASDIFREREAGNPLYLIREEIAVLKKLDHQNVVKLYEVLDDPEGDSLYMVMEMCERGAVMDIDMDRDAVPYTEDQCLLWFRDMFLGVEYLHAQGIVHRDIKPDNMLISHDDVLKIADFGVSEMFEKSGPMMTTKTTGSPAFMPPELCSINHGSCSGTAIDVWSMGVTLYCLLYGRLPFNHFGLPELCESIMHDEPFLSETIGPDVRDLLKRMLEKDPSRRITMPEIRVHPWVTCRGSVLLVPYKENTAEFISPPTQEELAGAVTKSVDNTMTVVKVVRKLKSLVRRKKHGSDDDLGRISPNSNGDGRMDMEKVTSALPYLSSPFDRPSTAPEPIPTISTTEYGTGETHELSTLSTCDPAQGEFDLDSTTPRSFPTSLLGNNSIGDEHYHLCSSPVVDDVHVGNY